MTRKIWILLSLLFLFASPSPSTAVDIKITDLTQLLVPDQYDMMVIVDDPSGTPVTKKVTVRGILDLAVSNIVYGEAWDGVTKIAPSMNVVYDKIETIAAGSGDVYSAGPGCSSGECFTDQKVTSGTTMFVWEGTGLDANEISFELPTNNPATDIVYTFPAATGTLARTSDNVASATVATALAANAANCVDGQAALGVDASGAGECVSLGASALTAEDFGAFTCTGAATGCSLDAIAAPAGSTWDLADSITALSVYTGTTSLDEYLNSATDSGAYIVRVYDEFANSNSTTVQGVLNDLDAAMISTGTSIGGLIFGDSSPDTTGEIGYGGTLQFYDASGLRTVISDATTDLPTAMTIGSGYIYRAGGTDVPDADVSDAITISGTGSVDPDSLTGDTIDDDLVDASSILTAGGTDEYLVSYETTGAVSRLVADIPIGGAGGVQAYSTNLASLAALTDGVMGEDILEAADETAVQGLLGYINEVSEDPSPVLGNDLDMSTFGIYGAFTNLTAASVAPSVAVGVNFLTNNATADVAINDFTVTTTGMPFRVVIADNYTDIDFSGAAIAGHGEALLDDPPIGTVLNCIDDGTRIDCDVSQWTSMSVSTWILPQGTTPAQTAEGSIYWDTDGNELTIGDAASRQVFVPTGTKTDELACSYETTGNKIDCDGSLGETGFTGAITTTSSIAGATAITMGSATVDTGVLTMIKGAQTSDPQTTLTMSADGVGGLTLATANGSNGDITLTPSGGDTIFTTDITVSGGDIKTGNIGLTIGDATTDSITLSGESETLVITPSADLVTVSTGTGVATIDFSAISLLTTGNITGANIKGTISSADDADGETQLTAANCIGQIAYNTTQANVYVLPAAAAGLNICFYATSAHAITIRPYAAGNDHIWYGASDCGEDDDLIGPATVGSFVCLHARDTVNWMAWGSSNTWACE